MMYAGADIQLTQGLVFYDRFWMFTSTDANGQLWLLSWCDEDEDAETEVWLAAPITEEQLAKLKAGETTTYAILDHPDFCRITVDYSWSIVKVEQLVFAHLPDEEKPDKDARIDSILYTE